MRASIDVGQRVAGARRVLVHAQRQAALELVGQLPLETLHGLRLGARARASSERGELRALRLERRLLLRGAL